MVSYFDLPPQQKAPAASIEGVPEERKHLGQMSFLSPAVTQLLDDLGAEKSDSDSEEGSLSEENDTKHRNVLNKKDDPRKTRADKERAAAYPTKSSLSPKKSERSPNKGSVHVRLPSARAGGGDSARPKQPHMARFHSLRSMLFSSSIEDKMKTMTQEDCQKEQAAANKWKNQHQQRQIHTRPKTPEKDAQGKDHGLGSRIKTKIQRMTSKEVPTMETLKEDGAVHDFSDHGSTASSDNEAQPYRWKPRDTDEESINNSDVEDLIRWVSRRDPPSDGEAMAINTAPLVTEAKEDSGHESLGHSDVEELVRWVSRKSSGPEGKVDHHTGYSDASTESDSEVANAHDSSDEEDADDLVRWISHRNGPNAGPVRKEQHDASSTLDVEQHVDYDPDVPELGRWIKRHDGTSGESGATTPVHEAIDEVGEPERGRPRSRDGLSRPISRGHMTIDDVDELVRWVSRKDSKQQSPPTHDQQAAEIHQQENVKKQHLGRLDEDDSVTDIDVQDVIAHVRSKPTLAQGSEPAVQTTSVSTSASSAPTRPGAAETGFLKRLQTSEREAKKPAAQKHLQETKPESLKIDEEELASDKSDQENINMSQSRERGSLKPEDVDELVKWVSRKS